MYGFLINWFVSCKVRFNRFPNQFLNRFFLLPMMFLPLLFVRKLSYCIYQSHYFIVGMWKANIRPDQWCLVLFFLFSGFVLLKIISSAIWHVLFEAPFGTARAEVLKMITMAMRPPPKSEQSVRRKAHWRGKNWRRKLREKVGNCGPQRPSWSMCE